MCRVVLNSDGCSVKSAFSVHRFARGLHHQIFAFLGVAKRIVLMRTPSRELCLKLTVWTGAAPPDPCRTTSGAVMDIDESVYI